jgi:hypothetical protein
MIVCTALGKPNVPALGESSWPISKWSHPEAGAAEKRGRVLGRAVDASPLNVEVFFS